MSEDMATYNDRLSQGEEFGLQHFTYNNSALKSNLFHHLEQTDYKGTVVGYKGWRGTASFTYCISDPSMFYTYFKYIHNTILSHHSISPSGYKKEAGSAGVD